MKKYHTVVWVPVQHPAGQSRPLIITQEGEPLIEAWAFFTSHRYANYSSSWFSKAADYIGKFYDFYFATNSKIVDNKFQADKLIGIFFAAIRSGTIQLDGDDPTGLRWNAWSAASLRHATHVLREFLQALPEIPGDEHFSQTDLAKSSLSSFAQESNRFYGTWQAMISRET